MKIFLALNKSRSAAQMLGICILLTGFYFCLGYSVAAHSRAYYQAFDCIFTMDNSFVFEEIARHHSNAYKDSLHPFFELGMWPIYHFFRLFLSETLSILAAQSLISSIGVILMERTLAHLPLSAPVRWLTTALYACCYTVLLFTLYDESYAFSGLTIILFYYFLARQSACITRLPHTLGMFALLMSGNIMNVIHYAGAIAASWLYKPKFTFAIKLLFLCLLGAAFSLLLTKLQTATGFTSRDIRGASNQISNFYRWIGDAHHAHVTNFWELLAFAGHSLVKPHTYAELFSNFFYGPLIGASLSGRRWGEGCISLDYYVVNACWYLAFMYLGIAVLGIIAMLKRPKPFNASLLIAYGGSFIFYGFLFIRVHGYFYSLNFFSCYIILIAYGMQALLSAVSKDIYRTRLSYVLMAIIILTIATSVYHIELVNQFALKQFS